MPLAWIQPFNAQSAGSYSLQLLRRIRRNVLVFYVLCVAITVTTVAWLTHVDYQSSVLSAQRQAFSLVRSLDEHATRLFGSAEQILQAEAEAFERSGGAARFDESALYARLLAKIGVSPQLRALALLGRDGQMLATSVEYPARQFDLHDRAYFSHHRDHAGPAAFIDKPIKARVDNKWLIPLSVRLERPGGQFDGVLMAALDPAYFRSFYQSLQLDADTRIEVLRNDGTLLFNHPLDLQRLGRKLPLEAHSGDETTFRTEQENPGQRLVAQIASTGAPLLVRVSFDRARVLQRFHTAAWIRVATALAVLAVLSLLLGVLLFQLRRLEQAEARLRLTQFAMDESPEMIVWCAASGEIRYANRRLCELSGRSSGELRGMRLGEIFALDTDPPDAGTAALARRLNGRETALRTAHGSTLPVELSAAALAGDEGDEGDGELLCLSARDIRERQAAQDELRRHRDHLQDMVTERTAEIRAVLDANPLAIMLAVQHRIALVNPAFESLFGYTCEHAARIPEHMLYAAPEQCSLHYDHIREALRQDKTWRGEAELRRQDGSHFWAVIFARALEAEDPLGGIVFIIQDVSAQRFAAAALRHSEQLKRSMLDAIEDGFVLLDAQRHVLDANRALGRQLGLSREQLNGRTPESLWGDALGARLFPVMAGAGPHEQELMLPAGDGAQRPYEIRYGQIHDEETHYRFAFFTDVSARHESARHLLEAKNSAEAANLAKTRFLTNMSHELRTPMHAILSFSEMGLLKSDPADDLTRYFERIQGAGQRLLTLLNDLLDLSRLEADRMPYTKRAQVLQRTVQNALGEMSAQITTRGLRVEVDEITPPLTAVYDPARLIQVLINLLSNAIRFSPEGGRIRVDFLRDAQLVDGRPATGFAVSDEGPGIAPEELELIFESFRQGQQSHSGGSGLGLAICRRIMRDHGGEIRASNPAQGGACFSVLLPATRAAGAT